MFIQKEHTRAEADTIAMFAHVSSFISPEEVQFAENGTKLRFVSGPGRDGKRSAANISIVWNSTQKRGLEAKSRGGSLRVT